MNFIKNDVKIFILSGKARAGKDTTALFIKEYYDKMGEKVITLQYSTYLKEYAKKITGWDGTDENKPRQLLIDLGTNLIRGKIDKYLFINRMLEDINIYSYFFNVIIISDARLVEELDIPREKFENVKIINIKRPNYENGLTEEQKNSLTETALNSYSNYDYEIINDKDIESLNKKIVEMIKEMGR